MKNSDGEVTEAAFNKAYESLNTAQKQAVDTIEGPVLVIAGPGTGKTQILTLRIANILLKTDTKPENILALTFTESGAVAMRERLQRYLGATAYRIPIHTFHGFAGRLIAQYPDAFPNIIGATPASDLEKITIIESILESSEIKTLRPAGNQQYYVTPLLRMISQLKQEYLTPADLRTVIEEQLATLADMPERHEKGAHAGKVRGEYSKLEKSITKNQELAVVYQQYEALLRERSRYDFDDMLVAAVNALKTDEQMLRDLQETYQYVLADEHQDVNGVQNTLLELLVAYHDHPNIFAVGDEKQAIYRFQGASLENFLYFESKFPGAVTVALTENYRSGQPILDAAHSLVAVDGGPLKDLRVPLQAALVADASVAVRQFSHQAVEDAWVVETVQAAVAAKTPLNEVAIIVRTNREVEQLAGLLRKADIPVKASADGDILSHPITIQVLALLQAVVQPGNQEALAGVLHAPFWQLQSSDVIRILAARSYERSLATILADEALLTEIEVQDVAAVHRVVATLEAVRANATHRAPHQLLEQLLQSSGFLDYVVTHDPTEGVRVIRRLYDEVEELVQSGEVSTLGDVVRALETRRSYGLPLLAPYIATDREAVQVMTAHKSKGLEFEVVLMPHVIDSSWGGTTKRTYFDVPLLRTLDAADFEAIDDEKRLLFVGMTRAKTALRLSSSSVNTAGKALLPSRLLAELDPESYEAADTDTAEASFSVADTLQATDQAIAIDTALLTELFAKRGFSATSLNNYLRSPFDYIYRNLLRFPETQALPMQYGTVMHDVLERMTAAHTKTAALPTLKVMKEWLEVALRRLPLSVTDYTELHERGLATVVRYSEHLAATLPKATKEELALSVVLPSGLPEVPEIKLSGKLDRLDLDEGGVAVRVVDYKTGKPRTRNAIMGLTKTDDGGYHRQLVFYALLLSLYDDERYLCREGVLSFVEADSKGVIKEESFIITDEEIEALKQEIIEAARAIISGEILTQPCDPETSSYCHLVAQLQLLK